MSSEKTSTEPAVDTAIQKFQEPGSDLLHLQPAEVQGKLKAIDNFQKIIKASLVPELDYGTIPGTPKPTLYKGGAEKIAKLLNLSDTYEIVEKIESWDKPFFSYTVKCTLTEMATGTVVCSYLASCNSYESKYRYRWVPQWKLPKNANVEGVHCEERQTSRGYAKFYRYDNEDIFSQVNTLMKMAQKRALVSAAVSVGRLSLIFTVDMEDYVKEEESGGGGGEGSGLLGKGPATSAANVRSEEPKAPVSADSSSAEKEQEAASRTVKIVDGRYTDDTYPPEVEITLPDKQVVQCSRYKVFDLYERMKNAVGEKRYYAVLKAMGYEKKSDVPTEEMHLVYAMLSDEWKKLRKRGK